MGVERRGDQIPVGTALQTSFGRIKGKPVAI
jgi:hypothetical protein